MYHTIFNIGNIIFYILMGISFILLLQKIIHHIFGLFPAKKFPDAKVDHKFAVLIPARNESAVIEQLLLSISEQNYNFDFEDKEYSLSTCYGLLKTLELFKDSKDV